MKKATNWPELRSRLKEASLLLFHFSKNPHAGMRTIPEWDWITTLILQGALAAGCGAMAGIVGRSLTNFFAGLIVLPLSSVIVTAIASGFFFYILMFFFKTEVPFKRLYMNVFFANIPLHITLILEPLFPPATLIGLAISAVLLTIGFVENFKLPKNKVIKLLGSMLAIYAIFWLVSMITHSKDKNQFRSKATPESLDILEKEFKGE